MSLAEAEEDVFQSSTLHNSFRAIVHIIVFVLVIFVAIALTKVAE